VVTLSRVLLKPIVYNNGGINLVVLLIILCTVSGSLISIRDESLKLKGNF